MFEWMLAPLRALIRERSNLFFSLVFPIMLVAILGNMLANLDNPDTPVGTISIAYCAEGAGDTFGDMIEGYEQLADAAFSPLAAPDSGYGEYMERATEAAAVKAFIEGLSEHEGVEMIEAADAAAALAEVDSGRADAAMVFGSPLSISVAEGKDLYKNRAVTLIAQNIAHEYAAYKTAFMQAPEKFIKIAAEGMPDFSGLAINKDLGASRSMMDFYAVTAIVMIAFMGGGIGGAAGMFFGRQNGTLRRVTASPRGRTRLFIENVVGVLPQNILQATIVMVVSTAFFGARYAKTLPENLLLFAFFVLLGMAVSAAFMLVGMFVRVNPYVPLMAALWTLLFMAGTFSKDVYIEGFSEYLPMSIAQRAAFDLTVFGRPEQLLGVMGACAVVLAVSCALGAMFFRRKEIML